MRHLVKYRILSLALFLFSATTVWGDTLSDVDSLLNSYSQQKGKERLLTGEALMEIYTQGAVFFDDTPNIDIKTPQERNDMMVWFGAVRFYTTNSYYSEAMDYIAKTLPLAKKINLNIYCTLLCDKSYCLYKLSDYTQAIEVGQAAVEQCKQTNNFLQLSRAYLYLALVNHSLTDYEESKALVLKSIQVNERVGANPQEHNALGIACEIFCSAREVDKAIEFGLRAVESARAMGYEQGVANHLMQLSYAYDRKGDYQRGLAAADSAIAIVMAQEPIDRNQLALTLEYKSWNLIDMGRNREAVDAINEAIRLQGEVGNRHAIWNDYRTLCEALEPIDVRQALAVLKRYTFMGDSIHSAQLKEEMSQANAQFHNDELRMESEHNRRLNRIILLSSLIFFVLLIAVIVSLLLLFRQRNRTTQHLQKLTKARETFFKNVTHEFRTPLTVIMGYGKRLKDYPDVPAEEVRQSGESIENEGFRLLGLVGELLDLAKLQSVTVGDITQEDWRTDNVVPYLNMMLEPYYDDAYRRGVELIFKPFENDVVMDFEPNYVRKLLDSLVTNAFNQTPAGGRVTVSTRRKGEMFVLQVTDSGEGLDTAQLETIFEPFSRMEGSGQEGSAIGLTLARQIVLSVGGTITADSTMGKGTTITVSVPINCNLTKHRPLSAEDKDNKAVYAELKSADRADAKLPTGSSAESGAVSILVVEDNRDVAYLIGALLADRGYSISYASNGRQGLEVAEQTVPDLIITDVMMSQMDGLELCRQIRANDLTNHIPIIVITARITPDDLKRGIESGADAYLFKPFDADELQLRIVKLLEMRQLLRRKYSRVAAVTQENVVEEENSSALSMADQKFIGRLIDMVYSLMGRQQVDVETVASSLNMTTSQLRRKLVALTGQTPAAYIMQIRLTNAQRLLDAHPEMSIADVAYRCGFTNQSHLSAAFQKMFGLSPTQWAHRPKKSQQGAG